MINPNKRVSVRATISEVDRLRSFKIQGITGGEASGWDLPTRFKVGDTVNVQVQFSITSDSYIVKSIRKT